MGSEIVLIHFNKENRDTEESRKEMWQALCMLLNLYDRHMGLIIISNYIYIKNFHNGYLKPSTTANYCMWFTPTNER